MLVDHFNDTDMNVLKAKIEQVDGAAERLEKVASVKIEDPADLTKEAFAWPDEKLFPIYSPSHALLSSVYLEGNDDVPGFVKEACEEACALFGLDIDIGSLQKTASEESLAPSDFLLPAMGKLPVVDEDSLAMSRGILEKTASDLKVDDLIVANRLLVKKASEFGFEPTDQERVFALDGHIDVLTARNILHDRYMASGDSSYTKLAATLDGDTIVSKGRIAEMVFDVLAIDADNNIEKTAAEAISELVLPGSYPEFITIDNTEFTYEKLASIDSSEWLEMFPRGVVEELFEGGDIDTGYLGEIVDSLSPVEKEAVASFIR